MTAGGGGHRRREGWRIAKERDTERPPAFARWFRKTARAHATGAASVVSNNISSRNSTIRPPRHRQSCPQCSTVREAVRMSGIDPKETAALRATTAAMKPRADIARIVIFITDAADLARARRPLGRMPPADAGLGPSSTSPSPTSSTITASLGSRRLPQAGVQPPFCSTRPLCSGVACQRSAARDFCSIVRPLSAQMEPWPVLDPPLAPTPGRH